LQSKTDVTKSYIDWAITNDFSVIDVNIPQIVALETEEVCDSEPKCSQQMNLTQLQSDQGFSKSDDQKTRSERTREMASYLWTNYIESVVLFKKIMN